MATWLCLHGFSGTPECFRALGAANPEATLWTPGLTGHGTPATAWAPSFDAEVQRLERWLSERGQDQVHLLGYSLGARLALGLLASHRQRFKSAVLIGANPGLRTPNERSQRAKGDEQYRQLLQREGLEAFVDTWEQLPLFASQRALTRDVLAEQRRARLTHTAGGLSHALRALGLAQMPDYWSELPKLDLPIVLVVGERDEKFRRIAEAMLHLLPSARLELAPGVGHNVVLESPAVLTELMRAGMREG